MIVDEIRLISTECEVGARGSKLADRREVVEFLQGALQVHFLGILYM